MIHAYKAFFPGLKGMFDFQYELDKTYTSHNDGIGRHGFHAAANPMFCLQFITPEQGGEYALVQLDGAIDRGGVTTENVNKANSAITGESIRIERMMSVEDMLFAHFTLRLAHAHEKDYLVRATSSSYNLARAQGDRCTCIADAEDAVAQASGYEAVAIAAGPSSIAIATGQGSLAVALGEGAYASGDKGSYLLLADWNRPGKYIYIHHPEKDIYYGYVGGELKTKESF